MIKVKYVGKKPFFYTREFDFKEVKFSHEAPFQEVSDQLGEILLSRPEFELDEPVSSGVTVPEEEWTEEIDWDDEDEDDE